MIRYVVVHDVDGPRVRLGIAWFVVIVGSAYLHRLAFGAVLAAAAALAADEALRLHVEPRSREDEGARPDIGQRALGLLADPARLPIVVGAASLPLAATAGSDTLAGAAVLVVVLLPVWRIVAARSEDPVMTPIGTLAILALGIAAACPVLLHRIGPSAAVTLLVLASAYDVGDFLVGTGSAVRWEGPAAGVVAVVVLGFAASAFPLPPLDVRGVVALAALTALLAPFGPLLGAVLVGDGRTPARFVRRLDVLLLLAPVAAWAGPAATG